MVSKTSMSLRRLRQNRWIRDLVCEYRVSVEQMIQPLFVVEGISEPESIVGLTGVYRETPQSLLRTIEQDLKKGVHKFLLFGVPAEKRTCHFDSSFTVKQIEGIRKHFGKDLFLAVDVCLCSSTVHGHCGVLNSQGDQIDNLKSVKELAQLALHYAQAGVDCVAPSDMMDGRVRALREILDLSGLDSTVIMSYSAKFQSQFYGPFRSAADSAPKGKMLLKDRATYQIQGASPRDAYLSSLRDSEEGADILMVKPGLPYLDVLAKLSQEIKKPWAVYQVSGEFAAIELMAQKGLMEASLAHQEVWSSFIRAGASMIITYGARFAKNYL